MNRRGFLQSVVAAVASARLSRVSAADRAYDFWFTRLMYEPGDWDVDARMPTNPLDALVQLQTLRIDPKLAPFLENNGGPTQTLALQGGSPAIDAGNNSSGLATDQRGAGFARMSGNGTDIGAFEVQSGGTGDLIFRNGFDFN